MSLIRYLRQKSFDNNHKEGGTKIDFFDSKF